MAIDAANDEIMEDREPYCGEVSTLPGISPG
jgi:hypothetical protein